MAAKMNQADRDRALAYIAGCTDPVKLRKLAANAFASGEPEIQRQARLKLYAVSPADEPDTLEHKVWQSILALEDALSDESGITKRLSRTRQTIKRDGEHKTVCDLVLGKPSPGFSMLIDRDMVERTFEFVALKFPDRFNDDVLAAARKRLAQLGEQRIANR